jgi:hypothetical protein
VSKSFFYLLCSTSGFSIGAFTTFTTACFSRNRRVSIYHILDLLFFMIYDSLHAASAYEDLSALVLNIAGEDSVLSTTKLLFFVTA